MMREKKFLDTVHGYIFVPEDYCEKLIDTPYFQRLRRIEQTSVRSLFPCARHDRFIHSLGVFHLGKKIVASLSKQIEVPGYLKQTFQIACLLHDCGHSPFSHTFEHLFGSREELFDVYKSKINTRKLDEDIKNIDIQSYDTKQHEILSAFLCITVFYEKIIELGANPSLVSRMIMGIKYESIDKSLEDCLISLLHGEIIDADKLDYICRDKWASGYLGNSVDLDRLIEAIVLYKNNEGRFKIAYSKSAINEIQALLDSKNFQTNSVFLHHQVVYEQKLLKDTVEELIISLQKKGEVTSDKLFNYKAFFNRQTIVDNVDIYMPTDDDIVYLMKVYCDDESHLDEWLSRKYNYFSLWKSRLELISLLGNDSSQKLLKNKGIIYDNICNEIKNNLSKDSFVLDATPTIKEIKKDQIEILFPNNNPKDFLDLGLPKVENVYKDQTFKYLFIENSAKPQIKKIIETIKVCIETYE